MTAAVQIVDGQPTVVVTNVDMGSLPIPQSVQDKLTGLSPSPVCFKSRLCIHYPKRADY